MKPISIIILVAALILFFIHLAILFLHSGLCYIHETLPSLETAHYRRIPGDEKHIAQETTSPWENKIMNIEPFQTQLPQ